MPAPIVAAGAAAGSTTGAGAASSGAGSAAAGSAAGGAAGGLSSVPFKKPDGPAPPNQKQTFASNIGKSAAEGIGGAVGGSAGNLIGDKIQGSPGKRTNDFMNEAYPGTNVAERIGSNAGGSYGASERSADTAKQVASISAGAQRYSADKQYEAKELEFGKKDPSTGQSPKLGSTLKKLNAEIQLLKTQRVGQITKNDWERYKSRYWDLYINEETAVPVHKVPFSKASAELLKRFANWVGKQTGITDTVKWINGDIDYKGNPRPKSDPVPRNRGEGTKWVPKKGSWE